MGQKVFRSLLGDIAAPPKISKKLSLVENIQQLQNSPAPLMTF